MGVGGLEGLSAGSQVPALTPSRSPGSERRRSGVQLWLGQAAAGMSRGLKMVAKERALGPEITNLSE